jgi:phospholipid-binding lipoprotein MlaA
MKMGFCLPARSFSRAFLALAFGLIASGCASLPGPDPRDPLEPMNRKVETFNENFDSILLKPVATAYQEAVPPLVRTGVSNFFSNLGDVWYFVNSVLQLRFQEAEENLARVQVNTIFGLGGIFDVASDLNIERHREDFGQTLGRWGVPSGPYIVLPFVGPSTMRDGLALWVDYQGDLVWALPTSIGNRNTLFAVRTVDKRANLLRMGNVIEGAALDKYTFTRDAYLQHRRAEVFDNRGHQDTDGAEPNPDAEEPNPDAEPNLEQPAVPAPQSPESAPAP